MTDRPYVLLSCAMSVDGHIDDKSPERLVLSNEEDLDRVDAIRAACDAILVGAATVRRDNPRLLVRSAVRRDERVARGLTPTPIKVTLTASGDLDPASRFVTAGDGEKLVYCASPAVTGLRERLGLRATVVDAGYPLDLRRLLGDLSSRGVRRLMVEGGGAVHTQFLVEGLADELQLVVAPFFVGEDEAPRFVDEGAFPWHTGHRMTLAGVQQMGDVVLLRYRLQEGAQVAGPDLTAVARDRRWLQGAVDLSRRCPLSDSAFSVGAVIVDAADTVLADGFSRDGDPHVHAEESALSRVDPADRRLRTATIYSSLEPCSRRRSRPRTCTQLIVAAGIGRVVFAWREPATFVDGRGMEELQAAGVEVVEMAELAQQVRAVNAHLLSAPGR